MNEAQLIDGLKKKELRAFRLLVDTWSPRLFGLAFKFLRHKEDAEEVVQEVLQKVVEKIETFREEAALGTWLHRVTVNESLMRLRSAVGKETLSYAEHASEFEDGVRVHVPLDWSRVPDVLFEQKELQVFLNACVLDLPEDLRAAYILKDKEEMSEDEVCDVLNITKPTMRNRVHKARTLLRERLENEYVAKS